MSSSTAVPTRDDVADRALDDAREVRRICALKPKVTSGETALFGADMAPIVRLLGQATSAIEDANQILRGYRREASPSDDGAITQPFDVDVAKASCDVEALRQAVHTAHSSIARRAIQLEIAGRQAAQPPASFAS